MFIIFLFSWQRATRSQDPSSEYTCLKQKRILDSWSTENKKNNLTGCLYLIEQALGGKMKNFLKKFRCHYKSFYLLFVSCKRKSDDDCVTLF